MITQETKPVKTWGGFNLAILKVNLNQLSKNRSFTIGCPCSMTTEFKDQLSDQRINNKRATRSDTTC